MSNAVILTDINAIVIDSVAGLLLMLYTPLSRALNLAPLAAVQFFMAVAIATISVLW